MDVSDPKFFMDEEEYKELNETLDEMLETYGKNLPMDKQRKITLL